MRARDIDRIGADCLYYSFVDNLAMISCMLDFYVYGRYKCFSHWRKQHFHTENHKYETLAE